MKGVEVNVKGVPFNLFPLGDIQLGTPASDVDRLREWIRYTQSFPNPRYVGLGDYIDLGSPSNRTNLIAQLKKGTLYDSVSDALDLAAEEYYGELRSVLEPTKGQWDALVSGHHYWEYPDGTTTDTRLADYLGCEHIDGAAYVVYKFAARRGVQPVCRLWMAHGNTGGKSIGLPLSQLEHVSTGFDADLYLIGHHHKLIATKLDKLAYTEEGLQYKEVLLASTGSWMKGYLEGGKKTYVEAGLMKPAALGAPHITVEPIYKKHYKQLNLGITL